MSGTRGIFHGILSLRTRTIIADFTGTGIVGNELRIWLVLCGPAIIETLSIYIFQQLKELTRFRKIILNVVPIYVPLEEIGWSKDVGGTLGLWWMRKNE